MEIIDKDMIIGLEHNGKVCLIDCNYLTVLSVLRSNDLYEFSEYKFLDLALMQKVKNEDQKFSLLTDHGF